MGFREIIGNTTATPSPRPDWSQKDPTKPDYIKNKPEEDYTTAEKTKLAGIEAGAQVNVQPDWSQKDPTAPDYIKNKTQHPVFCWVANGVAFVEQVCSYELVVVDGVMSLVSHGPLSASIVDDVFVVTNNYSACESTIIDDVLIIR